MLDLESEVMRGPGSIPTGGNILSLEFFVFNACMVGAWGAYVSGGVYMAGETATVAGRHASYWNAFFL